MFTKKQQGDYRPLVQRAWLKSCAETGGDPRDRIAQDKWYRAELYKAGGWYTTKQCNRVQDFNTLMRHFALIAGDDAWLIYLANANERNVKWLIGREMVRIGKLSKQPIGWNYVLGIMRHMGIQGGIDEVPASLLHKVFIALDMHRRRLLERNKGKSRKLSARAA